MLGFHLLGRLVDSYKERTVHRIYNVKDFLLRGGLVALTAAIILWIAIFLYVAFYYAYMPSITHSRPVHLQFKSCENSRGMCSYPTAHVQLTRKQQLLMVGQSYKLYLNLEMPESPVNKRLGMFMACTQMRAKKGTLVANACLSTMLHYRSRLLHILSTLIFFPLMLFGSAEEKQVLTLELFSDFEEDQNHPVTDIYVEIQSRHIELYSATLHIHAHFTGLRYLMFHWPVLSAAVGISSNLFFIVLICTLSWWHLSQPVSEEAVPYVYSKMQEQQNIVDEEKTDVFVFKGETDDSSFEDASFVEDATKEQDDVDTITFASGSRRFITELSRSDGFHHVEEQSEC